MPPRVSSGTGGAARVGFAVVAICSAALVWPAAGEDAVGDVVGVDGARVALQDAGHRPAVELPAGALDGVLGDDGLDLGADALPAPPVELTALGEVEAVPVDR